MANVFDTSNTGGVNYFDTWDATDDATLNAVPGAVSITGVSTELQASEITVITAIDNCNIEPSTIAIVNPSGASPQITVTPRPALNNITPGYRHFYFAVDDAGGKTPEFRVPWTGKVDGGAKTGAWRPVYTQDHVTWVQASSVTLTGGDQVFSFPAPLPVGVIYISSNFTGRQADADSLAVDLITNHASIASPLPSANASGVFAVSPAGNDDLGRPIGGNNMYAIKLAWGGSTSDGRRKRKMIFSAGLHAAGEQQQWATFVAAIDWLINNATADGIRMRQNFDVYLYFNINPNGLRQGNSRGKIGTSLDLNRDFAGGTSPEIAALKTAVLTDTAGVCDVYLEYHGDVYHTPIFNSAFTNIDADPATRSAASAAMLANAIAEFGMAPVYVEQTPNVTGLWFHRYLVNAEISMSVENPAFGTTTQANYDDVAEKWMKSVAITDAQGHLAITRPVQQTVINMGAVNSTRLYSIPTPSNYWIPASTDFCIVARVYKAPGAQKDIASYIMAGGALLTANSMGLTAAGGSGNVSFYFGSSTFLDSGSELPEGVWTTLCVSRVAGSITIRRIADGSGSISLSGSISNNGSCNFSSLRVAGGIDRYWRGAIDGVSILLNDNLSDGDLIAHASGGPRVPAGKAGNLLLDIDGTREIDGSIAENIQAISVPLSGTGWPLEDAPLPLSIEPLDATSGSVTVTGNAADLLTGELYDTATSGGVTVTGNTALYPASTLDAVSGSVTITGTQAALVEQLALFATPGVVTLTGSDAFMPDGTGEVFNATAAQITITGETAEAIAVMMQALPDNVIIRGNNAEFVQYAILDAISGSVVINGMSAFALSNIINATGGSVTISGSQAWATDPPFIEQRFYAVQEQRDQNMLRIIHKRGDTFRRSFIAQDSDGLPVDITNCTIESQVRNKSGTLLSTLAVAKTDPVNGEFDLTEEDTSGWPIYRPGSPTHSLYMDIQYTYPSGTIESTDTLMISVKEDVTL